MRKVIENQLKIGQVDIPNIQIDINCRDEIPQLLLGLQEIYKDKEVREKVFKILEKIVPTNGVVKGKRELKVKPNYLLFLVTCFILP